MRREESGLSSLEWYFSYLSYLSYLSHSSYSSYRFCPIPPIPFPKKIINHNNYVETQFRRNQETLYRLVEP